MDTKRQPQTDKSAEGAKCYQLRVPSNIPFLWRCEHLSDPLTINIPSLRD